MGHSGKQFELAASINPDVFSVSLALILPENDLILCRYNSGHHGHRNILEKVKLPPAHHQHITTQRYISAGLDMDGFAILRTDYNSAQGALALLAYECNIDGIFKPDSQSKLFPT